MSNNTHFDSNKYWENRYRSGGNSGAGSYNHLAKFKAEIINDFVKKNNIKEILEFGCGDGNNLSLYQIDNYIGVDVSLKAIEVCQAKFVHDPSKKFFTLDSFNLFDEVDKRVELVLSLDVIYHLIEDHVYDEYMNNLFNSSGKYIIIYSSNYDEVLCAHVKHRMFTAWIEKNRKDWFLTSYIKNKYEYDSSRPIETTFADFYIFKKDVN